MHTRKNTYNQIIAEASENNTGNLSPAKLIEEMDSQYLMGLKFSHKHDKKEQENKRSLRAL